MDSKNVINISERGVLTLPLSFRKEMGLPTGGQVRVTLTSEGVVLTPIVSFPIEIYSDQRVSEFDAEEEKLSRFKTLK